jgi:hypothetical protein
MAAWSSIQLAEVRASLLARGGTLPQESWRVKGGCEVSDMCSDGRGIY